MGIFNQQLERQTEVQQAETQAYYTKLEAIAELNKDKLFTEIKKVFGDEFVDQNLTLDFSVLDFYNLDAEELDLKRTHLTVGVRPVTSKWGENVASFTLDLNKETNLLEGDIYVHVPGHRRTLTMNTVENTAQTLADIWDGK